MKKIIVSLILTAAVATGSIFAAKTSEQIAAAAAAEIIREIRAKRPKSTTQKVVTGAKWTVGLVTAAAVLCYVGLEAYNYMQPQPELPSALALVPGLQSEPNPDEVSFGARVLYYASYGLLGTNK